jgi:hypothetical protein
VPWHHLPAVLLLFSWRLHQLNMLHRLLAALQYCLHWLRMHLLLQSLLLLHHQLGLLGLASLQLLTRTLS